MPDVAHQLASTRPVTAVAPSNRRTTVLSRLFPALRHRTHASPEVSREADAGADADGILAELERISIPSLVIGPSPQLGRNRRLTGDGVALLGDRVRGGCSWSEGPRHSRPAHPRQPEHVRPGFATRGHHRWRASGAVCRGALTPQSDPDRGHLPPPLGYGASVRHQVD